MNSAITTGHPLPPFFTDRALISSSFFLPIFLMRGRQRRAMQSLYHFCHAVDSCADDIANRVEALAALHQWQEMLDDWHHGRPLPKGAERFFAPFAAYEDIYTDLNEILAGVRMDSKQTFCIPCEAELERYSYQVAGCVGLAAIKLFDCTHEQSKAFAIHLGHAFQYTNIARDILDDAKRGRIYLAREWCNRYALNDLTPEMILTEPAIITPVLQHVLQLADRYYILSETLIHPDDRRALLPALMMKRVYHRQLKRMMQYDNHLTENVSVKLSFPEKLLALLSSH